MRGIRDWRSQGGDGSGHQYRGKPRSKGENQGPAVAGAIVFERPSVTNASFWITVPL